MECDYGQNTLIINFFSCSLRELRLDGNDIRSMVSAAFRHVNQLETLSLRDNQGCTHNAQCGTISMKSI